jgi:hypothetical protein
MTLIETAETFSSLLCNKAHWEFELFVGLIETIVIDLVFGLLLWKGFIKPYITRKRKELIEEEHRLHGIKDIHD